MKKSLLALAVLGAFAGVAQAESSVTLFGVVDMSVQRVTNDGKSTDRIANDGNASSRLGFRGVEDLAPGLQAGFWLEAALVPDSGAAGAATAQDSSSKTTSQLFNRRATVSLISANLGEVRVGRDYTPTFWNQTQYDPFGTNGVGNHNNVMNAVSKKVAATEVAVSSAGKASTFVRSNNSLGYFTPKMAGMLSSLSAQAMYALPEGDASVNNKYLGARVVYASGPMTFAWSGATIEMNGLGSTKAKNEKVINLAGSYELANKAKLMYQLNRYTVIDDSTGSPDNQVKNYLLGATIPVSAALTVKVSYNAATTRLVPGSTAYTAVPTTTKDAGSKQIALGAVYDLSKRSAVYATYSRLSNSDNGTAAIVGSVPAGKTSAGLEVGVRHSF